MLTGSSSILRVASLSLSALLLLLLSALLLLSIRIRGVIEAFMNTLQGPVEDVVHLVPFTDEEVAEELLEVAVVGLVLEAERAVVVEVGGELGGEALAECLDGGRHLLLGDAVVLLLLGLGLETLPGEGAAEEVEEDVADGLEVIAAALLDTKVSADGAVAGGTGEVLALLVGDVLVGLGVAVLLGEAEVDDVDVVAALSGAHQEVVGLDVTVEEVLGVDVLDSSNHLIGEHQRALQGELSAAEVEEVLERGAEEIDDHDVVVTFNAVPPNGGDTNGAAAGVEDLVEAGFVQELGVAGLDGLELDGDGFTSLDVGATVNITERTRTDLLTDAEFVTNAEIHFCVFYYESIVVQTKK